MSGAFVKFTGLDSSAVNNVAEPIVLGSPCLYHEHSGADGTNLNWRDSGTLACIDCSNNISKGELSLDLKRLHSQHLRRAVGFWKHVDIQSSTDCWRWTKPPVKRRLKYIWPRPDIQGPFSFHPIRVMMWLTWGDTGRLGCTSLCGERRCMNPLHNIPLDLSSQETVSTIDLDKFEFEIKLLKCQLIEYEEQKQLSKMIGYEASSRVELGEEQKDNYLKAYNQALLEAFKQSV